MERNDRVDVMYVHVVPREKYSGTESVDAIGPSNNAVATTTTKRPGTMRSALRVANLLNEGSRLQLWQTRNPLIAKKTATARLPRSLGGRRDFPDVK